MMLVQGNENESDVMIQKQDSCAELGADCELNVGGV
jgi:hypothetical protein